MNLEKTAVAHRTRGSNEGILIITGDFVGKQDLISKIETELSAKAIMVVAKTCIIAKQGCIITIDRDTNKDVAVEIVNETLEKMKFTRYKARAVPKPKVKGNFRLKDVGLKVEPNTIAVEAKQEVLVTKQKKESKAKKDWVRAPYSSVI